ncbi:unnamed protein product [Vicia faba]|uniref:Uncharacterized protein n=1 Tax=Vicia faba TaxID=3906 RepID=A0AAV0ZAB7_VICFA|nr:unnamed protein product [Vicia faba]
MPYCAAFRSSKHNECYVFSEEKFVVCDYAPGEKKTHVNGPIHISDGFPMLAKTVFEKGIDCTFDIKDNQAFIFHGNQCAMIKYAPDPADTRLLLGPIPISGMFPCLKGTVFENGINAAIHHLHGKVIIFNGNKIGYLNYKAKYLSWVKNLLSCFPYWDGTVFTNGIIAAFNSHNKYEAYIFNGKYYARINYCPTNKNGGYLVNHKIRRIRNEWPALHGILLVKEEKKKEIQKKTNRK